MSAVQQACCGSGPGFATPLDAFTKGPREKLCYVPCIVPDASRPDYLATVDLDPESPTYSTVIHRLSFPYKGDEIHHMGWNACSSCFGDPGTSRKMLVLPALGSGRVYGVDVQADPRAPKLHAVLEPEEIQRTTGLAFLHTSHCLGSGEIMISAMGDKEGNARGGFLLLDQDLKIKGAWSSEEAKFGYDYWYQPRHNVMISSSWGAPKAFSKGFDPAEVPDLYGRSLFVWDWKRRRIAQEIDLGQEGAIPLEVRFLHDPAQAHGFVGCALSSNVVHFTKAPNPQPAPSNGHSAENGEDDGPGHWVHSVAIKQEWTQVDGWVLPAVPPLISDILISLNDRFLYFSNWLRGDVVQYDISNPAKPRLVGRLFLGGLVRKDGPLTVQGGLPDDVTELPDMPTVKGNKLRGGPQMLQLSLDGQRLYVTNSLFGPWDKQFYPELVDKGCHMLKINVNTETGGMTLDPDFFVDFGQEPGGPVLAHEVRLPQGDCSSDIWL